MDSCNNKHLTMIVLAIGRRETNAAYVAFLLLLCQSPSGLVLVHGKMPD